MPEVRRCVVAAAKVKFEPGPVDLNRDPAEAPVPLRVAAAITQQVVKRAVLLYSGKHLATVVGIKESHPARVSSERDQGFLGGGVRVEGAGDRFAGVWRGPEEAGVLGL